MKTFTIFILGISILLILNLSGLFSYFSQDDFFHLNSIADKQLGDLPKFYIERKDYQTFYRPLSRETFNFLMYKVFTLNPLPYHLFNLFLIISISFLIYKLVIKILKNQLIGYLAVLIYLLSAVHNVELYYLASVQNLLMTLFSLSSFYFYIYFKESNNKKHYFFSVIFFILGILSHEQAIVLPGLLLLLELFFFKKVTWKLLPFFIITAVYLIWSYFFINLPKEAVYNPIFNFKSILNTLSWYIVWSFGISEILVDFMGHNLNFNFNFFKWYPWYVTTTFASLFMLTIALFITLVVKRNFLKWNHIILYIGLFIVSILPFLFFPQKKFVYYLELPIVWFSILLAIIFSVYKSKLLIISLLFMILAISYQTTNLNKITYWAAKRADAAEILLKTIKKTYPNPKKGAIFYIKNDPNYPFIAKQWGSSSKQAFYILSGENALQLIYRDKAIKAYYEDINPPLKETIDKLLPIKAEFPY